MTEIDSDVLAGIHRYVSCRMCGRPLERHMPYGPGVELTIETARCTYQDHDNVPTGYVYSPNYDSTSTTLMLIGCLAELLNQNKSRGE